MLYCNMSLVLDRINPLSLLKVIIIIIIRDFFLPTELSGNCFGFSISSRLHCVRCHEVMFVVIWCKTNKIEFK